MVGELGPWADLVRCVVAPLGVDGGPLARSLARLLAGHWLPFEVIAGSPAVRYGARITLRRGDRHAPAHDFAHHPWGTPDWIGVRLDRAGAVRLKAYHRGPPPVGGSPPHRGLPPGLTPVMAACEGDQIEVYGALPGERSWPRFARDCLRWAGGEAWAGAGEPGLRGYPRQAADQFAASVKYRAGAPVALSLYAFDGALPDDRRAGEIWSAGLGPADRQAYQAAYAGAQSTGRHPAHRYHAAFCWTYSAGEGESRSVSLRLPPAR